MKYLLALGQLLRNNKAIIVFAFLMLFFRGAIADWHPVPTGSMKPTILEGDVIIQNKLAYDLKLPYTNIKIASLGEPKRGDIVVINPTDDHQRLVKRLIGLPGDEITLLNNVLTINGLPASYITDVSEVSMPLRQSDIESVTYALEQYGEMPAHTVSVKPRLGSRDKYFHTTVPDGHYFFMGDNRDNSADSRYYGSIPREQLSGRANYTLASLNILDKYKPRFERFFARLN